MADFVDGFESYPLGELASYQFIVSPEDVFPPPVVSGDRAHSGVKSLRTSPVEPVLARIPHYHQALPIDLSAWFYLDVDDSSGNTPDMTVEFGSEHPPEIRGKCLSVSFINVDDHPVGPRRHLASVWGSVTSHDGGTTIDVGGKLQASTEPLTASGWYQYTLQLGPSGVRSAVSDPGGNTLFEMTDSLEGTPVPESDPNWLVIALTGAAVFTQDRWGMYLDLSGNCSVDDIVCLHDAPTAVRQYPRDDTLGWSGSPRIHPPPRRGRVVGRYQ